MKHLIATSLFVALSLSAKSQQTETTPRFNASDPTQLYTNVNLAAGTHFETNQGFELGNWQISLAGDFAIKKLNIGFNVPFSNIGNTYTLLEDIDLHAGYQLFNSDQLFKSSLLTIGTTLPTSFSGYGNSTSFISGAKRTYYANYTASFQLTEKLALFPTVGVKSYRTVGEESYYNSQDSTYKILSNYYQLAFQLGLSASYQFTPKSFVQLNSNWETGTWKSERDGEEIWAGGPTSISRNQLFLSLKYQYAFTNNAHAYIQIQNRFAEKFENDYFKDWFSSIPGVFIGFQYFIK